MRFQEAIMVIKKKGMVCAAAGLMAVSGNAMAGVPWQSAAERNKVDQKISEIDKVIQKGPFKDDWDSLKNYRVPDWFQDAKFGIFIHWGLYSVPAYANEWYTRNMYREGDDAYKHHLAVYGPQKKFGLKDFIPLLKAEKFNPAHWAKLFKDAGARYVVPVAEHHDGFAMYDCGFSRWTAAKMGPKRDILGELSREFVKQGLVNGASSHRAEHWWFMNGGMKFDSDVKDPKFADFYGPAMPDDTAPDDEFLRNWLARSCELVDKYKPRVVYFDWWIGEKPVFQPYVKKFAAYYYNRAAEWKQGVVLCTKDKAYVPDTSVMDMERGGLTGINERTWQTDTSISWGSWGYLKEDHFKDAGLILKTLIDAVSKNGNLLLNVGPKPDGTLPKETEQILSQVGQWLKSNGEAVFGTRPWIAFGEGPTKEKGGKFSEGGDYQQGDVRFTRKGNALYIFPLAGPTQPMTLTLLGKKAAPGLTVKDVVALNSAGAVKWERSDQSLVLSVPVKAPTLPMVYKVSLGGVAQGDLKIQTQDSQLTAQTTLQNYDAVEKTMEVSLSIQGKPEASRTLKIPPLSSQAVSLSWSAPKPGYYKVSLNTGSLPALSGAAALPAIDLSGKWLFSKGDNPKWANRGIKDSDWEKVILPASWESHSNYTEDNVYGWYRKSVVIPAEWKGHDLILPLGKIDDCDETYFNGMMIGKTGKFPPKFEGFWNQERRYAVPAKFIHYGKENVIAVKVFDATGGGGIYDGPLGPIDIKR
jgi:alpha-L-fucosidase